LTSHSAAQDSSATAAAGSMGRLQYDQDARPKTSAGHQNSTRLPPIKKVTPALLQKIHRSDTESVAKRIKKYDLISKESLVILNGMMFCLTDGLGLPPWVCRLFFERPGFLSRRFLLSPPPLCGGGRPGRGGRGRHSLRRSRKTNYPALCANAVA
jgi:hypothetical protein